MVPVSRSTPSLLLAVSDPLIAALCSLALSSYRSQLFGFLTGYQYSPDTVLIVLLILRCQLLEFPCSSTSLASTAL